MALVQAVMDRLEAQVPELAGRIRGAKDIATLLEKGRLAQQTPAAHVLPLGLRGGRAEAMTGMFTQLFDEAVGVVLTVRSADAAGARVLDDIDGFLHRIIAAVAGWGPSDEVGVFVLARGQLVGTPPGAVVYQLDFTITDQLRIAS